MDEQTKNTPTVDDSKPISGMEELTEVNDGTLTVVVDGGKNKKASAKTLQGYMQKGVVKEAEGKGLSTNDYTDEDRQKLEKLPSNEQFGIVGRYSGVNGGFAVYEAYRSSGFMVLNPNVGLKYNVSIGGGVAAVAFFDSDRKFISAITTGGQGEIDTADFPENAVYFTCSTTAVSLDSAFYANGETIESREGVISDVIMPNLNRLNKEHVQFGIKFKYIAAPNGNVAGGTHYFLSEFIILNKDKPIATSSKIDNANAFVIAYFDGDMKFISGLRRSDLEYSNGVATVTEHPENAVYFRVSMFDSQDNISAWYRNGDTMEAREGAVSGALAKSKLALFVDQWNAAWGAFGKYDPVNAPDAEHPFLGNKIWMTYAEAMAVMLVSDTRSISKENGAFKFLRSVDRPLVRTLLPLRIYDANITWLLGNQPAIETVVISQYNNATLAASVTAYGYCFAGCNALKTVEGVLDLRNAPVDIFAVNDIPLEKFYVITNKSLKFDRFPKINLASLQYLVNNAANTSEITITVHPDVYSKLSDETNAEWYKVMTDAAAKNISFATTE